MIVFLCTICARGESIGTIPASNGGRRTICADCLNDGRQRWGCAKWHEHLSSNTDYQIESYNSAPTDLICT